MKKRKLKRRVAKLERRVEALEGTRWVYPRVEREYPETVPEMKVTR